MHAKAFEYLPPNENAKRIREAAAVFAEAVDADIPDGADKAYAMRQFRTAVMWMTSAALRQPDGTPR